MQSLRHSAKEWPVRHAKCEAFAKTSSWIQSKSHYYWQGKRLTKMTQNLVLTTQSVELLHTSVGLHVWFLAPCSCAKVTTHSLAMPGWPRLVDSTGCGSVKPGIRILVAWCTSSIYSHWFDLHFLITVSRLLSLSFNVSICPSLSLSLSLSLSHTHTHTHTHTHNSTTQWFNHVQN